MKVTASVALSLDGFIDDGSPNRLMLSSGEDFAAVEKLRSTCDAIMVGANTVRRDDPSLLTKSEELRSERQRHGLAEHPMKITITSSGNLDVECKFFEPAAVPKLVFCSSDTPASRIRELQTVATVTQIAKPITANALVSFLEEYGVRHLLVEGGAKTLRMFWAEELIDTLRIAIAPVLVNDNSAPSLFASGLDGLVNRRLLIINSEKLGDTVAITYKLK